MIYISLIIYHIIKEKRMQQLIVFVLLSLFVHSYYAIDLIPTPSDIPSISDDLTPISCDGNCAIAESYINFIEYYSNKNHNILKELPTFEIFKDYLSKEGDLDIINNYVEKYVSNIASCYNFRDEIINNSAIVVTDMQYSFMSNGPVPVHGAEYAIDFINEAKKYHEHSIHSLDTHLPLWSLSFSTNPDYVNTFYPHARADLIEFKEVNGLNTCADLYVGKKDFAITSNPLFKEYLLKNGITKVTFTGVAGDYCVYAGILGVLDDPELSHIDVALYEPGVKWVFPDSINVQRLNLESYSKFNWINDEEELLSFLNNKKIKNKK